MYASIKSECIIDLWAKIQHIYFMSWKDHLRPSERAELERAEASREAAREVYNATVRKLKSRCESRIRVLKDEQDG